MKNIKTEGIFQPSTITIETEVNGFKYTYKLNCLSFSVVQTYDHLDYQERGGAVGMRLNINQKIELRAECIDGIVIQTEIATRKEVSNHRLLEVL